MDLRKQITRFIAVGTINTLIDVTSYAILIRIGLPLWLAILISTTLGMACSYMLNRSFTFNTKRQPILQFLAITLTGLWLIQPVIIYSLASLLDLKTTTQLTVAKLIATGFSMVWNFVGYRLIFNSSDSTPKTYHS